MDNIFDRFLRHRFTHVKEDQLLAYIDGELPRSKSNQIHKHLERCWTCGARVAKLQSTIHGFVGYSNEVVEPFLPPPSSGRDKFVLAVNAALTQNTNSWWRQAVMVFNAEVERLVSDPIVPTIVVVVSAALILLLIWSYPRKSVSRDLKQVLRLSMKAESSALDRSGVEYQKVEITSDHQSIERVLYRDLSNKKTQRQQPLSNTESLMRARLASAGVNWDNPLSPSDYNAWHDRVKVARSSVVVSPSGELTLKTETSNDAVRESSLIVREMDFHAIGRHIKFRDNQEVQIAEVNYDVLPFTAVNMSIFEPVVDQVGAIRLSGEHASLHGAIPAEEALIRAELHAELTLLQHKATSSDALQVEMGIKGIRVVGLVDTDARKLELDEALKATPLVSTDIKSLEQIERMRTASLESGPLHVENGEVTPSPLDKEVTSHAISQDQAIALSRALSQSALTIAREGLTLDALDKRYRDPSTPLSAENLRLLSSLTQKHLEILSASLSDEERVLAGYSQADTRKNSASAEPLSPLVVKNRALVTELISSSNSDSRPASEIINDLVRISSQIRSTITHIAITFPPT